MDSATALPTARDGWLVNVLRRLLPAEALDRLLHAPGESLWLTAVRRQLVTDAALLAEAAAVSGLELWDGTSSSENARALVGDEWSRRLGVVPVDATATDLRIATANPFD